MSAENPLCACGHVLDEHDAILACTVDGCDCFYFDADEPDESEATLAMRDAPTGKE